MRAGWHGIATWSVGVQPGRAGAWRWEGLERTVIIMTRQRARPLLPLEGHGSAPPAWRGERTAAPRLLRYGPDHPRSGTPTGGSADPPRHTDLFGSGCLRPARPSPWRLAARTLRIKIWDRHALGGNDDRPNRTLSGHKGVVNGVASDGQTASSLGRGDQGLDSVGRARGQKLSNSGPHRGVFGVALGREALLASAALGTRPVKLWDVQTRPEETRALQLEGA